MAIDIHGNQTVSRTRLDAGSQTRTQTIDYPDSTIDAETVTVGGLLASSTSKTGVTTTFGYDALGRRTTVVDPRTGTTHYDDQGQVDWIEDAAGNRTEFDYDPTTGRKIAETNPANKVTRFAITTGARSPAPGGTCPIRCATSTTITAA